MTDGADPVLAVWRHAPTRADRVPVLPDGCRDLILHRDPRGRRRCFVSPLTDGPTPVASQPGERYWGFRLRPGIGLEARLPVAEGWPAGLTDGDADDDDGRREAAIRDWLADQPFQCARRDAKGGGWPGPDRLPGPWPGRCRCRWPIWRRCTAMPIKRI